MLAAGRGLSAASYSLRPLITAAGNLLTCKQTRVAQQCLASVLHGALSTRNSGSSSSSNGGSSSNSASSSSRQDASTGPASAAASAAAAYKAELGLLQSVGLNQAAAAAVHKAWYDGRLNKQLHLDAPDRQVRGPAKVPEQPPSPKKVLALARNLISAHQAAAKAAQAVGGASPTASLQQHEAAPQPAPDRQLTWGDVDIHSIIRSEPQLLMVPLPLLSDRMTALVNAVAGVLGPQLALHYVQQARNPEYMLANPQATAQQLQSLHDTYVDVMGVAPKLALLAASESSHVRQTPQHFRKRLEGFVKRYGAESAHTTLSRQPHLLASGADVLKQNSQQLQKLLGCSEKELQRVVSQAPRVLNTKACVIASNLQQLTSMLLDLGASTKHVRRAVLRFPNLLTQNPVTLRAKVDGLQELLGDSAHRLWFCVTSEPSILGNSTRTLAQRLEGVQKLLGVSKHEAAAMFVAAPFILSLDLTSMAEKVEQLVQVLALPRLQVQQMCKTVPTLLGLKPSTVDAKLNKWTEALQVDKATVVNAIQSCPGILQMDADSIVEHMRMMQALVPRSRLWMSPRQRPNQDYRTFLHDAKQAMIAEGMPAEGSHQAALELLRQYRACLQQLEARQHQRDQQQQQQRGALQQQPQEQPSLPPQEQLRPTGRGPEWPLAYAGRNSSGRLLLRLEFLLATGRQEQVSLWSAEQSTAANWRARFPDFPDWLQLRLETLKRDPGEWPPSLLSKVLKNKQLQRA